MSALAVRLAYITGVQLPLVGMLLTSWYKYLLLEILYYSPQSIFILFSTLALKADIDIVADLGYSMLIQDMARQSAYFCEKSGAGGFIGVMLCTVQSYMNNLVSTAARQIHDLSMALAELPD